MPNEKYLRAAMVLRREIPALSQDAACRVLDALLDAVEESQNDQRRYIGNSPFKPSPDKSRG